MSWLVAEAQSLNDIKQILGATDMEDGREVSFCVTATPDQKLFVFETRGREWTFDGDAVRQRLSAGREMFFCMLEEHVMASEAACWRDGREVWRVEHDSQEGVYHLDARGTLPVSFESIRQARFAEQDQGGGEDSIVDFIISVPMDLAAEFTGYDGGIEEPEGDYFQWCSAVPARPTGILQRLMRVFKRRNDNGGT